MDSTDRTSSDGKSTRCTATSCCATNVTSCSLVRETPIQDTTGDTTTKVAETDDIFGQDFSNRVSGITVNEAGLQGYYVKPKNTENAP